MPGKGGDFAGIMELSSQFGSAWPAEKGLLSFAACDAAAFASDSAFAFACNSYDRATVASGCTIDYMYGAREGDLLTATAEERARGGRTGVYDITLTNQDGRTVALFRGRSYEVRGTVRNPEDNS